MQLLCYKWWNGLLYDTKRASDCSWYSRMCEMDVTRMPISCGLLLRNPTWFDPQFCGATIFAWLIHMTYLHDLFTWLTCMTYLHVLFAWLICMAYSHDLSGRVNIQHRVKHSTGTFSRHFYRHFPDISPDMFTDMFPTCSRHQRRGKAEGKGGGGKRCRFTRCMDTCKFSNYEWGIPCLTMT